MSKPLIQQLAERCNLHHDNGRELRPLDLNANGVSKLLFELCAYLDEQAADKPEPPTALEEPLVQGVERDTREPEALWPLLMARLRAMPNSEMLHFDFEGVGIAIQKELASRAAQLDEARAALARAESDEATERERGVRNRREARAELAKVAAERDYARSDLLAEIDAHDATKRQLLALSASNGDLADRLSLALSQLTIEVPGCPHGSNPCKGTCQALNKCQPAAAVAEPREIRVGSTWRDKGYLARTRRVYALNKRGAPITEDMTHPEDPDPYTWFDAEAFLDSHEWISDPEPTAEAKEK